MTGYRLSLQAEDDVFEIWSYLAERAGTDLADRATAQVFLALDRLARSPELGHKRSDLTDVDLRFFRVRPYAYLIAYSSTKPVEIVAVLHAKRDLERILKGR